MSTFTEAVQTVMGLAREPDALTANAIFAAYLGCWDGPHTERVATMASAMTEGEVADFIAKYPHLAGQLVIARGGE